MEKNNYLISAMEIEDLENIKDILETDFDEFWNYETLKEELESNFSRYFIAKQNDNIVGFAGLKIILDEADLMNIVTKKCCRHEGIASNIMDKLIEHCKQEKIKLVYGAKIVDRKGAVKWAFRCSSCYGTIWLK